MTVSPVPNAPGSTSYGAEGLSPEAMMIYLSSRLGTLDDGINELFDKQKSAQGVQEAIRAIQSDLAQLNDEAAANEELHFPDSSDGTRISPMEEHIIQQLDVIAQYDPRLAEQMRTDLGQDGKEGMILYGCDGKYSSQEVKGTKSYLDGISKDLDATAQLDMIRLQSLMSSRQTAIQLSTNLISSMDKSLESIVTNIR